MSKFLRSFIPAFKGISIAFKGRNFRIQFFSGVLVIVFGVAFHVSIIEWLILILCIAGVLTLEIVNTSIEQLSDRVTLEIDYQIRKVKDLAAGAVLIFSIFSAIIALIIFLPKILHWLIETIKA